MLSAGFLINGFAAVFDEKTRFPSCVYKKFILLQHFFRTMGWSAKYNIEFKGLREGLHEFEYEIEDTFFEQFDQNILTSGNVTVKVELEKRSTFMKLYFKLKGYLELTCDRCLDNYRQKIKNRAEIFVKFSETNQVSDDQVIWILPEEHRINLAQIIYEYIILSIPLRHIHPDKKNGESGCNQKMIEKLNDYTPKAEEKEHDIDPRWEALKKLKNSNLN
jgi:uncharacterized protein